jgi:hypothetical protein
MALISGHIIDVKSLEVVVYTIDTNMTVLIFPCVDMTCLGLMKSCDMMLCL